MVERKGQTRNWLIIASLPAGKFDVSGLDFPSIVPLSAPGKNRIVDTIIQSKSLTQMNNAMQHHSNVVAKDSRRNCSSGKELGR